MTLGFGKQSGEDLSALLPGWSSASESAIPHFATGEQRSNHQLPLARQAAWSPKNVGRIHDLGLQEVFETTIQIYQPYVSNLGNSRFIERASANSERSRIALPEFSRNRWEPMSGVFAVVQWFMIKVIQRLSIWHSMCHEHIPWNIHLYPYQQSPVKQPFKRSFKSGLIMFNPHQDAACFMAKSC